MNLFNQNKLLGEIRRIVKEEIKAEYPNNQLEALWKAMNEVREDIVCLEKQSSDSVGTMISKYLVEDNKKRDEVLEE